MELSLIDKGTFPRPLAEGLWVVGNYFFNLYLVQGERASALIEVGVSAVVDDVIRQLRSLGISPTVLVVTHPHADHVTGLDGLREAYPQALVVAGEGAKEFLAHPKASEALLHEDRHMTERLAAHGIQPGRPPIGRPPSLSDCITARDGYEMHLGGKTLRFLSVKGHAPGKIVVWVPGIRALFPSDSLGFRFPGRGAFPPFFTGYHDYIATLDRLQGLNPAIVGPAHQGPVLGDQVEAAFEESVQTAVALRKSIREDSRDPDVIAAELFERFFKDELTMYTPENIMNCCKLLMKRAKE